MKKDWKQIWEEAEKASRQYGSLGVEDYAALGLAILFVLVFIL